MKKLVWVIISILLSSFVYAESIFLSDYMKEGQTKIYETENGSYVLSLLSVSESKEKVVFRLNDEMSKGIRLKDSHLFDDGSEVVVREMLITEAAEGEDEVYYYFYGTGEGVLNLRNVSKYVLDNRLCNFDTQCRDETKEDCCYDCGCNEEKECINNECVSTEEEIEEEELEEIEEEVVEEEEEEIKEEKELTTDEKEKKTVHIIIGVIVIFFILIVWFVMEKKRSIF